MLHVIKFIFEQMGNFISFLFTIDMGFMSVGTFLCCVTFGVPAVTLVFNLIKGKVSE